MGDLFAIDLGQQRHSLGGDCIGDIATFGHKSTQNPQCLLATEDLHDFSRFHPDLPIHIHPHEVRWREW